MISKIYSELQLPLLKRVLIHSMIYNLLFNSMVYYYKFGFEKKVIFECGRFFIWSSISSILFFWGISFKKNIFQYCCMLVYLSGGLYSFYYLNYASYPSPFYVEEFVNSIFNGNFKMHGYDLKSLLFILCSGFIGYFTMKNFSIDGVSTYTTKIGSVISLFLVIYFMVTPNIFFNNSLPGVFLNSLYRYFVGSI